MTYHYGHPRPSQPLGLKFRIVYRRRMHREFFELLRIWNRYAIIVIVTIVTTNTACVFRVQITVDECRDCWRDLIVVVVHSKGDTRRHSSELFVHIICYKLRDYMMMMTTMVAMKLCAGVLFMYSDNSARAAIMRELRAAFRKPVDKNNKKIDNISIIIHGYNKWRPYIVADAPGTSSTTILCRCYSRRPHFHTRTHAHILFHRFNIYEHLFDELDLCTQINFGAHTLWRIRKLSSANGVVRWTVVLSSLCSLIKPLAMFRTVWIRPSTYINNSGFIIQFRCVWFVFSSSSSHKIIFSDTVHFFYLWVDLRELEILRSWNKLINNKIDFHLEVFIIKFALFYRYYFLCLILILAEKMLIINNPKYLWLFKTNYILYTN